MVETPAARAAREMANARRYAETGGRSKLALDTPVELRSVIAAIGDRIGTRRAPISADARLACVADAERLNLEAMRNAHDAALEGRDSIRLALLAHRAHDLAQLLRDGAPAIDIRRAFRVVADLTP